MTDLDSQFDKVRGIIKLHPVVKAKYDKLQESKKTEIYESISVIDKKVADAFVEGGDKEDFESELTDVLQ